MTLHWIAHKTSKYLKSSKQLYTLEGDTAGRFPRRNRQVFHSHTHEGGGAAGKDRALGETPTGGNAE